MATIQISGLNDDQLEAIVKALGCVGKIEFAEVNCNHKEYNKVLNKRLDIIMNTFEKCANGKEKLRLEVLYGNVRKRGYKMLRKTFTRDIQKLNMKGKLKTIAHRGGKYGNTTFLIRA